jgi:hypothetical protein
MNPSTTSFLTSLSPDQLVAVERLRARFAQLPDCRMPGRILHRIDEVVMIALCSILSDNDAFTDMEAFAKSQLPWLRTFLPLTSGAPSHDVFRNVFMALQPQALLDILAEWCGELNGRQVTIDGKALRGSDSAASGQKMVHVLRAWVSEAGISGGKFSARKRATNSMRCLACLRPSPSKEQPSPLMRWGAIRTLPSKSTMLTATTY